MENYKTGLMGNGLITQDEKESKGYKKWVKETKKKSAWQSNDGKKKKIAKKMGKMSKNKFFTKESIEAYDKRYRKEHPGYKSKLE